MAASNCVTSAAVGCIFCCTGCNASTLLNFFAFSPPPPSYKVRDNKVVYVGEEHYHQDFQAAADIGRVEFLRLADGDRVPVVWFKHQDTRACRDPDGYDWPLDSMQSVFAQHVAGQRSAVRGKKDSMWTQSCFDVMQCGAIHRHHRRKIGSLPSKTPESSSLGHETSFLVIHFHSNATDMGQMMSLYHELSQNICVDVLGVEYSGYGAASGQASPDTVMQVADAVYKYAVKSGVPPSRILLYGHSIGSAPALALAKGQPVAGVLLHAPFLSGMQVLDRSPESCCKPSCIYGCCDFFHNEHAVRSVRCPVFIMHGRDDVVVPFYHGVRLRECLPENCAWPGYFPEGACHNDLIEVDPDAYHAKLRAFVKSILKGNAVDGEMATSEDSEDHPSALLPPQVVMVSVSSGITRDQPPEHPPVQTRRPTQPGSTLAGRTNSPRTPRGGGSIGPDPRHLQTQRQTQPGSGLDGCNSSHGSSAPPDLPGIPGSRSSYGTAADRHSRSAGPFLRTSGDVTVTSQPPSPVAPPRSKSC